jgi:hypothetical protein
VNEKGNGMARAWMRTAVHGLETHNRQQDNVATVKVLFALGGYILDAHFSATISEWNLKFLKQNPARLFLIEFR